MSDLTPCQGTDERNTMTENEDRMRKAAEKRRKAAARRARRNETAATARVARKEANK